MPVSVMSNYRRCISFLPIFGWIAFAAGVVFTVIWMSLPVAWYETGPRSYIDNLQTDESVAMIVAVICGLLTCRRAKSWLLILLPILALAFSVFISVADQL
jgi:hypothetical protein